MSTDFNVPQDPKAEKAARKAQRRFYQKKRYIIPAVLVTLAMFGSAVGDDTKPASTLSQEAPAPAASSAPATVVPDQAELDRIAKEDKAVADANAVASAEKERADAEAVRVAAAETKAAEVAAADAAAEVKADAAKAAAEAKVAERAIIEDAALEVAWAKQSADNQSTMCALAKTVSYDFVASQINEGADGEFDQDRIVKFLRVNC